MCEETGLRLHLEGLDGGHLHQVSMGAKQGQLVACVNMVLQLAYSSFLPYSGQRRMQNKAQFLGREWARAARLGHAGQQGIGDAIRENAGVLPGL